MKFRISWLLYVLYILFMIWAFKYDMVEKHRDFFAICFILSPILLNWFRKKEAKQKEDQS